MKNYLSLAILGPIFTLSLVSVLAQTDPIPIRKGEKWSYTGIGGTYDQVAPFYPIVQKMTAKVPVRDEEGKIVKDKATGKPEMQDSIYFKEVTVIAAVQQNGKWGFISKDGKPLVPPKYDFVKDFDPEGLAAVGIDGDPFPTWGFINTQGQEITPSNTMG